jgi:hypothetical protein
MLNVRTIDTLLEAQAGASTGQVVAGYKIERLSGIDWRTGGAIRPNA